jgi:VIT1/CCC1 family predicted Fe2+/Mn2+ transporter
MEQKQMSAGGMILLAIILGAILALWPFLAVWLAWVAIILLFIGGLLALFTR